MDAGKGSAVTEEETTVDWVSREGRNMYGCLPCPSCGSEFRAAFGRPWWDFRVECDECGLVQPARLVEHE